MKAMYMTGRKASLKLKQQPVRHPAVAPQLTCLALMTMTSLLT